MRGPIIPSRLGLPWSALLAALLVAGLAGCAGGTPRPAPAATTAQAAPAPPAAAVPLRAVLFGYIPDSAKDDFRALRNALTERFQAAAHPPSSLSVTIDPNLNLYDFKPGGELSTLLGSGAGAVDVVEVDTLLLALGGSSATRQMPPARVRPDALPEPRAADERVAAAWP